MDVYEYEELDQRERAGDVLSVVERFRLNKERQRRAEMAKHPLQGRGRFVVPLAQPSEPAIGGKTK